VKIVPNRINYLGVFNTEPKEYTAKYGQELKEKDVIRKELRQATLPIYANNQHSTNYQFRPCVMPEPQTIEIDPVYDLFDYIDKNDRGFVTLDDMCQLLPSFERKKSKIKQILVLNFGEKVIDRIDFKLFKLLISKF
jgi:hypothetical protein